VSTEHMTAPISLSARIAVELRCPPAMEWHLAQVLGGEYESGYAGEGLKILDIGANAGAFSIWAAHRWPGSTIEAYEPDPGSFQMLRANTHSYPMIRCNNFAIYPSDGDRVTFTSRYGGDGEAGVVEVVAGIFSESTLDQRELFQVPALHPRDLPSADIVKIDAQGAEEKIVEHADFSATSLLLIEYHSLRYLTAIKAKLSAEFEPVMEQRSGWAEVLTKSSEYHQSLADDSYGLLFLLRRGQTRLHRLPVSTDDTNHIATKPPSKLRILAKSWLPPALADLLRKARDSSRERTA
jgi:FkbM family methyltransferase